METALGLQNIFWPKWFQQRLSNLSLTHKPPCRVNQNWGGKKIKFVVDIKHNLSKLIHRINSQKEAGIAYFTKGAQSRFAQ